MIFGYISLPDYFVYLKTMCGKIKINPNIEVAHVWFYFERKDKGDKKYQRTSRRLTFQNIELFSEIGPRFI